MVGRGGAVPERLGGSGGGREVRAPGRYFVIDVESNWLRGSVFHTQDTRASGPPPGPGAKTHRTCRRSTIMFTMRRPPMRDGAHLCRRYG